MPVVITGGPINGNVTVGNSTPGVVVTQRIGNLSLSALDTLVGLQSGWASYVHVGAAQTLVANTKVTLANNAGTVIDAEKPADITSFYTNGLITGRNGDSIILGVNLTFTPSSGLASKLTMAVDIGGSIGEIEPDEFAVLNGSGVAHRINYTKAVYMGATFASNGGAIKVMSDGPGAVAAMIFTMHRLHKA